MKSILLFTYDDGRGGLRWSSFQNSMFVILVLFLSFAETTYYPYSFYDLFWGQMEVLQMDWFTA